MGKSVRLLVPQLLFYKVGVLTYTFLLELSSGLKERKHESESLWWRVFGDCGVAETGYSPRHLISTLPPFNTGMVLVALLTWLDLTIQVSVQMSSPPRSRPWLRMASFTLCPVILYCIIFILSQGALITICNSHLIDLPSCSQNADLMRAGVLSIVFTCNITLPGTVPNIWRWCNRE